MTLQEIFEATGEAPHQVWTTVEPTLANHKQALWCVYGDTVAGVYEWFEHLFAPLDSPVELTGTVQFDLRVGEFEAVVDVSMPEPFKFLFVSGEDTYEITAG